MGYSFRLTRADRPLALWIPLALGLDLALVIHGGSGWDLAPWEQCLADLQRGGYAAPGAAGPPLLMHWLWLCAGLLTLLHRTAQAGPLARILIAAPVLACHGGLVLMAHRLSNGPDQLRSPWRPAALAALNPALLIAGPLQGEFSLVYALMLAEALYLLIAGRQLIMVLPLLALSLLAGFPCICLLPVLLPLLWRRRGSVLWAGALPALLLAELALLPYWLAGSASNMLRQAYTAPAALHRFAGIEAGNLWRLFGATAAEADLSLMDPARLPAGLGWLLTPRIAGAALFAAWGAWLAFATWRTAEAARHWRNALLAALGLFLFMPDPHGRDLLAVALLAVVAAARYPRFAGHALALSALAALEQVLALAAPQSWLAVLLPAVLLLYALAWLAWPWLAGRGPGVPALRPPAWPRIAAAVLTCALVLGLCMQRLLPPPPVAVQAQAQQPAAGWLDATRIAGRTNSQGWGTLHLDQSVEGGPLRVGGTAAAGGFGTHAPSIIHLPVPPGAIRFSAAAGIDDEAQGGRVAFQVFADGQKLWDSGPVLSGEAPRSIDLDVRGRATLDLVVDPLGDMDFDHSDWLQPRFVIGG